MWCDSSSSWTSDFVITFFHHFRSSKYSNDSHKDHVADAGGIHLSVLPVAWKMTKHIDRFLENFDDGPTYTYIYNMMALLPSLKIYPRKSTPGLTNASSPTSSLKVLSNPRPFLRGASSTKKKRREYKVWICIAPCTPSWWVFLKINALTFRHPIVMPVMKIPGLSPY